MLFVKIRSLTPLLSFPEHLCAPDQQLGWYKIMQIVEKARPRSVIGSLRLSIRLRPRGSENQGNKKARKSA